MRINKIELMNFGSYEGKNSFDIAKQSNNGRIVLIGGKNGSGKTTLFTAIKLCLYGYKESGYQTASVHYKNKIKKLVNDRAKVESNPEAYVLIDFSLMNGQDWDKYIIKREWHLNENVFEKFEISKNGEVLSEEEIYDFESFIMNLIPPELFELYFFDGEEIAEFFLGEQNSTKLKEAFLTLCGYDTFDILYKYFKRISKTNDMDGNHLLQFYLEAEKKLQEVEGKLNKCKNDIAVCDMRVNEIEAELADDEKRYKLSGGLSINEWKEKFQEIKNEEVGREEKNVWLKNAANDMLPYIILRKELEDLKKQMDLEHDIDTQEQMKLAIKELLPSVMEGKKVKKLVSDELAKKLLKEVENELSSMEITGECFLLLSKGEYTVLSRVVDQYLEYDGSEIRDVKLQIKDSIERVRSINELLRESSIDEYDSYTQKREKLLSEKADTFSKKAELTMMLSELEGDMKKCQSEYAHAEKMWEKSLKSESVEALTGKTIKYLDKLQDALYENEKTKVEKYFMKKIKQLMRKENFIDKIQIDKNFEIHIYKRIVIECKGVSANIVKLGTTGYEKEYGKIHCADILKVSKCKSLAEFVKKYKGSNKVFDVMLEFDKETMSKGEKQVFIMALYWAIMQLCNKEVPFVIDTPFARIDTEHREHITNYFFKELSGQVFIFSTNEEIVDNHINLLNGDIQARFLIENLDNKKTLIKENAYFGE